MDKIYGRAIGRGRFDTVSEKRTVSTRFADFLICSYDKGQLTRIAVFVLWGRFFGKI
jgi:hypothetical protein